VADLTKLEEQLNKDPQGFLKDPVAALKKEGVHLTPQHEAQLREQIKALGAPAKLAGTTARVEVSVSVSVRF
jgi:hypothetical protein